MGKEKWDLCCWSKDCLRSERLGEPSPFTTPGDFPPSPGAGRVGGQPCALAPLHFDESWYLISGVSPIALGRECHAVEAARQKHRGIFREPTVSKLLGTQSLS